MHTRRLALALVALLAETTFVHAQEVVVTGPPPELRKNLDAFQKAFNTGDAAQYETMAKSVFTAAYLKKQTAEERKKAYLGLHEQFGSIQFRDVERRGPDAPLEITVKGSVASGTMWIALDGFKIDSVKGEAETKAAAKPKPDADRHH
jgi:hypothetical protein